MSTPTGIPAPGPGLTNLLIGVLCLVWGSTWLVIAEGLDDLPPWTSLSARFVLAWALFALLAPRMHRLEGGARPGWVPVLAMGVCNDAASYAVLYWAEQTVPSGLTCVLWGVFPLLMAVAAHWLLPGDRLDRRRALGFVLGFLGLVLLFAGDLRAISSEAVVAGAVLLLSPALTVAGTVVIKRTAGAASAFLLCRDALLVAWVLVLPLALVFEHDRPARWTAAAIGSVVYLAVLGTGLTFSLYFWLLRFAAASKLSLIAYVTPAVALLLGWLVRGEPIRATTVAGAGLVVAGVALAGRRG